MSTHDAFEREYAFGVELTEIRKEIEADLEGRLTQMIAGAVRSEVERAGIDQERLNETVRASVAKALEDRGVLSETGIEQIAKRVTQETCKTLPLLDEASVRNLAREEAALLPVPVPDAELRMAVVRELDARGYSANGLATVVDDMMRRVTETWWTLYRVDEQLEQRVRAILDPIVKERRGATASRGEGTSVPAAPGATTGDGEGVKAETSATHVGHRGARAHSGPVATSAPPAGSGRLPKMARLGRYADAMATRFRREWPMFAAGIVVTALAVTIWSRDGGSPMAGAGDRTAGNVPSGLTRPGPPSSPSPPPAAPTLVDRLAEYEALQSRDLEPLLAVLRMRGSPGVNRVTNEFAAGRNLPAGQEEILHSAFVQAALNQMGHALVIDGDIKRSPCAGSTCAVVVEIWRSRAGRDGYPSRVDTGSEKTLRDVERLIVLDWLRTQTVREP